MVSEAGTVRLVELELRAMVPPADPLRMTVQVLEAAGGDGSRTACDGTDGADPGAR